MKKTLLTHAVALGGAAMMVGGLLVAAAPSAEGTSHNAKKEMRSGVGNDRTGNTVNNQGMRVSPSHIGATNDDIAPAAGSTAPKSTNDYGTTGSNNRQEIKEGR